MKDGVVQSLVDGMDDGVCRSLDDGYPYDEAQAHQEVPWVCESMAYESLATWWASEEQSVWAWLLA